MCRRWWWLSYDLELCCLNCGLSIRSRDNGGLMIGLHYELNISRASGKVWTRTFLRPASSALHETHFDWNFISNFRLFNFSVLKIFSIAKQFSAFLVKFDVVHFTATQLNYKMFLSFRTKASTEKKICHVVLHVLRERKEKTKTLASLEQTLC